MRCCVAAYFVVVLGLVGEVVLEPVPVVPVVPPVLPEVPPLLPPMPVLAPEPVLPEVEPEVVPPMLPPELLEPEVVWSSRQRSFSAPVSRSQRAELEPVALEPVLPTLELLEPVPLAPLEELGEVVDELEEGDVVDDELPVELDGVLEELPETDGLVVVVDGELMLPLELPVPLAPVLPDELLCANAVLPIARTAADTAAANSFVFIAAPFMGPSGDDCPSEGAMAVPERAAARNLQARRS